jgi:hypothetical protein
VPDGAHVVSATLDGAALPQVLSESPRLALPLPNRAGVRRLHMRWTYDASRESLTNPNLDRPRLDGARDGPVLYTVLAPPGFEPAPGATGLKAGLAGAGALDLAEAAAQLSASSDWGGQRASAGPGDAAQLADAQQRFAHACRRAQRVLEALEDKGESGKPAMAEQLQALQTSNRHQARRLGYEDARVEAEQQAWAAARALPGEPGLPLYAVVGLDEAVPRLTLQSVRDRQQEQKRLAAVAWLTMLAVVGLLACFRGLVSVVQWFWPEEVMLLGAAAWLLAGPTLLALLLILLGVTARGVYLFGAARRLLVRPRTNAGTTSHPGSGKRSGT